MENSTDTKQETKAKSWFGVLFPGCLFIPLFLIGWGISIVWLFFFLIWIICALWFFLIAIHNLISLIMKRPALYSNRKVLRHLIPCIVIPVAFYISLKSSHTANAYAVDIALTIQERIATDGVCPKTIEGWEQGSSNYRSTTYYGKYGAKYRVIYQTNSDQQQFNVRVIHFVEWVFVVKGGVGKELESYLMSLPIPLDYYKKSRLF
jgi:hypothetical protein